MDFTKLQHFKFDFSSTNTTLTSLPSTLLDALIPGYGIFSQLIFRFFGFDIGLVVSGCLVVFGLSKGAQDVYRRFHGFFSSYFMSTVSIESNDQLFSQLMKWIAEQRMTQVSRDLKAVTKWVSAYEDSDEERNARDEDVLDESGIFNYEKWASNIPPQFEPNYGNDVFYFEGRKFMFARTRREKQRRYWSDTEDEYLTISCWGRSTEPIKDLLNAVKRWTLTKENKMTSVYRPGPKDEGGDCDWDRQSCRPSRPMSTVSLDQHQKAGIVMDINEYLHPASARWYAARGIPYRRGYLFHGPPGTGKTSLSFALAGIFGLDIYCISLMERGLTEAHLNKLFANLPRRCIVLLEDIDSAGLRRDDAPVSSSDDSDVSSDGSTCEDETTKVSKMDAPPKPQLASAGSGSLISLSGLLNTIDGAASHEGRVLIMTTNHPEKLDPALIRPGRVDLQVHFTLATYQQTRDIFKRMYSADPSSATPSQSKPSTSVNKSKTRHEDDEFMDLLRRDPVLDIVEPEKLKVMAEEFAGKVPEGKFTPAEIQGFLLTRKKEPSRALKEVEEWRDALLDAKRRETKVLSVQ